MPYYFHWYINYRLKNTHPVYPIGQNTRINFSHHCSGLSTTLLRQTELNQPNTGLYLELSNYTNYSSTLAYSPQRPQRSRGGPPPPYSHSLFIVSPMSVSTLSTRQKLGFHLETWDLIALVLFLSSNYNSEYSCYA